MYLTSSESSDIIHHDRGGVTTAATVHVDSRERECWSAFFLLSHFPFVIQACVGRKGLLFPLLRTF